MFMIYHFIILLLLLLCSIVCMIYHYIILLLLCSIVCASSCLELAPSDCAVTIHIVSHVKNIYEHKVRAQSQEEFRPNALLKNTNIAKLKRMTKTTKKTMNLSYSFVLIVDIYIVLLRVIVLSNHLKFPIFLMKLPKMHKIYQNDGSI